MNIQMNTTCILTKMSTWKCTKKIYSWAQSAPVQHDKETTSENLHSTALSWSWLCLDLHNKKPT